MPGIPQQRRAEHTAALYRSGDFIVERVASFIAEGLGLGEQVLVMCTIAHWNTIASRLESSGVVYGRATSDGRLVFVDAEEALDTITENGAASAARFGDMLQSLLTSTTKTSFRSSPSAETSTRRLTSSGSDSSSRIPPAFRFSADTMSMARTRWAKR